MQTLVIYDSKFGNTEKVAEAIGRGTGALGDVRVMTTAEARGAAGALAIRPDLLFLGGPTQKRGPSPALRTFLDVLPAPFRGLPVAAFDTRYGGPTLLMGSAAAEVAKVVRRAGGTIVAPPESFFIGRHGPMERQTLEPGEIERAEQWGRAVADAALTARAS